MAEETNTVWIQRISLLPLVLASATASCSGASNGEPSPAGVPVQEGETSVAAPISEDRTGLAQPLTSARSFAVPRRPAMPTASEAPEMTPTEGQRLVAPCGHINAPGERFCHVCGQPISPAGMPESNNERQR